MEHPHWELTDEEIVQAASKGFMYEMTHSHFLLKRKADEARIWPHIDGFISAFIRHGMYVKHTKFREFAMALDRHFSD